MSGPRVSVIIPTFNNGTFLAEALDSVLGQQCAPCEIIVVDDGSTDNTREVISPYLDRVEYVYQANAGVSAARNRGIRTARGQIIAFLDGDDVWYDGNLELKLDCLGRNPDAGAVFSNFRLLTPAGILREDGMRVHYPIFYNRGFEVDLIFKEKFPIDVNGREGMAWKGNVFESLLFGNFIKTSTMMIRKECVDETGFFREDLKMQEDYEYFLRLVRKRRVALIDLPLVGHRRHKAQLTDSENMAEVILYVARALDQYRDMDLPGPLAARYRKRRSEVLVSLGFARLKKGERAKAADAFRESFRIDPSNYKSLVFGIAAPFMGRVVLEYASKVSRRLKRSRLNTAPGSRIFPSPK